MFLDCEINFPAEVDGSHLMGFFNSRIVRKHATLTSGDLL